MGKIIAITNQKGGVGKTTTSVNLAAALAYLNKKVLLIDIDPQANATQGIGIDRLKMNGSIYDLIVNESEITDVILKSNVPNLDVVPSSIDLAGADLELAEVKVGRERRLKEQLALVRDNYDYLLIDCPPSLGLLNTNALTASDTVIMPVQCEYYALEGLSQLIYTINLVKDRLNPRLQIDGVVFTMYDGRTNLSLQVIENVRENLDHKIYNTIIPRSVRLAEAPSYGLPISIYDSKSTGAKAYRALAEEMIEKGDEK